MQYVSLLNLKVLPLKSIIIIIIIIVVVVVIIIIERWHYFIEWALDLVLSCTESVEIITRIHFLTCVTTLTKCTKIISNKCIIISQINYPFLKN